MPGTNAPTALDLLTCPLDEFALAVHRAAHEVGNGPSNRRDRKVFTAAVADQLEVRPGRVWSFMRRLAEAHRRGHLELVRADYVASMPSIAVAASEIRVDGAEYHFVVDRAYRDPWDTSDVEPAPACAALD